ncbi:MAG: hypothetical protein DRO40_00070 [Thermoprotei archaeon]|nr:MAG: hypothetical protein DRO40_00070 [Thermoprotei archaeon]
MKTRITRKDILIIGDRLLCLIGSAAGTDYIEFSGTNCKDVHDFLNKNATKYGVIIVSRETITSCKDVNTLLKNLPENILSIIIDTPRTMEKLDVKKHYEDIIRKYIGLKITL